MQAGRNSKGSQWILGNLFLNIENLTTIAKKEHQELFNLPM